MRRRPSLRTLGLAAFVVAVPMLILPMSPSASSGAPHLRWRREAGSFLSDVTVDQTGSVYVVGSRSSRSGEPTLLVRKFTSAGGVVWSRTWRPANTRARGAGVAVGPDGSVYVVGSLECRGVEGGGMFVRSYGPGGRPRWTRMTPGVRSHRCRKLKATERAEEVAVGSGLVVVAGQEHGCCGMAMDDAWVRTYSYGGRLLWSRDIEAPAIAGTNDGAGDVAIGGLGRIYFAGHVEMQPNTDTATLVDHEILIQKLAPDGALIWTRVLRDRGGRDRDRATGVAVRADRLVVTAHVDADRRNASAGHAWLGRFTFGGTLVWKRTWGRSPGFHDLPTGVSLGPSLGIVVVGERGDRMFVRRLSRSGSPVWTTVLRGPLAGIVAGDVVDTPTGPIATGSSWSRWGERGRGIVWRWSG